ncbi:hypothetical protein [Sinimarinibacterium flocculans]|uniref:hypothetical protein n=1 Tax=Sinimarinibacterium flocculans TaxID=985250 RepID=UPI002491CBF6|nr:hypothetical protein [Sinimarinibacterium flocculans]
MAVKKGSARWKRHRRRVAKVQIEKKRARAQGLTIQQYRDKSTPLSLKPRTEDWVRREAKSRVNLGYSGAEKAIGQAESAANNLAAKRKADDEWFADWIAGQHDKMVAGSKAAGQALADRQRQIAQEQAARYANSAAANVQAANERAGNVSANAGSTTLQNQGAANAAADQQSNAASLLAAQSLEGGAHAQRLSAANNASASGAAAATKKAHSEDLQAIAKDRAQLGAQKSKDYADLLTMLFSEQTSKASANREYEAAAASLGLKAADSALKAQDVRSRARDRAADNRLNREKYENPKTTPKEKKKKASQRVKDAKEWKKKFTAEYGTAKSNVSAEGGKRYINTADGQKIELTHKNFARVLSLAEGKVGNRTLAYALAQQLIYQRVYDGTWQAIRKMAINPKGLGLRYGGKAK